MGIDGYREGSREGLNYSEVFRECVYRGILRHLGEIQSKTFEDDNFDQGK